MTRISHRIEGASRVPSNPQCLYSRREFVQTRCWQSSNETRPCRRVVNEQSRIAGLTLRRSRRRVSSAPAPDGSPESSGWRGAVKLPFARTM